MISNKKAMAIGQVFIFMVAAITFALILIFGTKAILEFMDKGERVEFTRFKTNLETNVKKIYTEYGSVRIKSFNLPSKYNQICFIDLSKKPPQNCLTKIGVIACDAWKTAAEQGGGWSKADRNVFLQPASEIPIKVYEISMDNNYLCLPIKQGRFQLRLEGKGDRTDLSLVEVS
tara:strand:- start:160 stop:681 length:522 start_codon:yes stop_codon:yes gene_type:complete